MNIELKESIVLETSYRRRTNIFLEPLLLKAGSFMAIKIGCRTRSKYIRYSLINQLIRDDYPLKDITDKYNKFYDKLNQQVI
jgi:hypothetical protein